MRVARTVVLEARQENLVRGHTQFVEPVERGVMLNPTKGVVEKTQNAGHPSPGRGSALKNYALTHNLVRHASQAATTLDSVGETTGC